MKKLTIAIGKGRIGKDAADLFAAIGSDTTALAEALNGRSRSLVVPDPGLHLKFILAKSMDVPTFVEYGAADLGIVGKDVLLEANRNVAELADLRYSACSFILAVPEHSAVKSVRELESGCRVASKYPRVTTEFLAQYGIQADVIPLNGSVELAPLVGLADAVVDITQTGRTLQENGLRVIADVGHSSARLIANRISYKVGYERIGHIVQSLQAEAKKVYAS